MYKPKNEKERIHHRLRIVSGHLQKVIKMSEEGAYCLDIIHQSQAVQKALHQIDHLILENHLNTCTANAIKKGKAQQAIAEVMEIIKRGA